jgi:hypothetical protein
MADERLTCQPVIIIGAPRSGTNMLRDGLARLDDFHTWPCDEINFVWKHGNLSYLGDDLRPDHIKPQTRRFVVSQFEKMARESGAHFIVEKTCANSVRVAFVDALVPEAKYILLVRNGRDAVASTIKRWQAPSSSLGYLWQKFKFVAPADRMRVLGEALNKRIGGVLGRQDKAWKTWGPVFPELTQALVENRPLAEICALQWAHCVKRAVADLETMEPSRWTVVEYEKFVSNPAGELMKVLGFLGASISETQVRAAVSGVHATSIGNSSRHLDAASLEAIDSVIAACGVDISSIAGS